MSFSEDANWLDTLWSIGLRDLDGSLYGHAGSVVVPNIPFNDDSSCVATSSGEALICNYDVGLVRFTTSSTDAATMFEFPFTVVRSGSQGNPTTFASLVEVAELVDPPNAYNDKFNSILDSGYEYLIAFASDFVLPPNLTINFQARSLGQLSPTLHIWNLGENCVPENVPAVASIFDVRTSAGPAYYTESLSLYLRLETAWAMGGRSQDVDLGKVISRISCD